MNDGKADSRRIVKTIEGITALCLGSTERVVWVDQADAAAFSDDQRVFLPAPSGAHPDEYELLLALALREVAKIRKADAAAFTAAEVPVVPFAAAIEEVRLKAELAKDFRGAPGIFNRAVEIARSIFAKVADEGGLQPADLHALAAWSSAHAALLGTQEAEHARDTFTRLAAAHADASKLQQAMQIAARAPYAVSTSDSVELGFQIWQVLQQEPPEPPRGGGDDAQEPAALATQGRSEDQSQSTDGPKVQQQDGNPQETAPQATGGGQSGETGAAPAPADDAEGASQPDAGVDGDVDEASPEGSARPEADGFADSDLNDSDAAGGGSQADSGANEGSGGGSGDSGDPHGAGPESGGAVPQGQPGQSGATGDEGHAEDSMTDPLSDALARLKGHAGATDVSSQAGEFRAKATAKGAPDDATGLEELRAALKRSNVQPADLQAAACGYLADCEQGEGELLSAVVSAGDGYADAANNASRSLLTAVPARLVTVLLRELQDLRRRPFLRSLTGPRVIATQTWRLATLGDARVFRKKAPATGVDAAVSILLDCSLSMRQNGFEQAIEVINALLIALTRIQGVQTSLDRFPGRGVPSEELLAFKQSLSKSLSALKAIMPSGSTPMGSALAARLRQLVALRCAKKFLIVVTDGQPDPSERPLTIGVIEQAHTLGIDVIGIGIGIDVSDLFPISASVSTASQLPAALAKLSQNELAQRLTA
jgi:hypothetical protein